MLPEARRQPPLPQANEKDGLFSYTKRPAFRAIEPPLFIDTTGRDRSQYMTSEDPFLFHSAAYFCVGLEGRAPAPYHAGRERVRCLPSNAAAGPIFNATGRAACTSRLGPLRAWHRLEYLNHSPRPSRQLPSIARQAPQ